MNKYQEALDFLCDNSKLTQFNIGQSQWASETLQELVDKATPKKPIIQTFKQAFGNHKLVNFSFCPVCRARVEVGRCCSNNDCRQAIDWSEDE